MSGRRKGNSVQRGDSLGTMAKKNAKEAEEAAEVERHVHAAMLKMRDANSFYRSKGCRDLVALGKQGRIASGKLDRELWNVMTEMLVGLVKDVDEDVRRFAEEALILAKARFNHDTKAWELGDKSAEARQKKAMASAVHASVNASLMDGGPVYRQYNAWRQSLLRSLRENRTIGGSKNMELISHRANGTKINRIVNFRGFLPDKKGESGDRLYYVTDTRTEKAEQVALNAEGYVAWPFKLSCEHYTITGWMKNISSYIGEKFYDDMAPVKCIEQEEDPGMLQYRRIAWNACSDLERSAFLWPLEQEGAADKHTDNLMRMALQGLCMDPVSHMVQDPTTVFQRIDKDNTGTVNFDEFVAALKEGKVFMGEFEKKQLWDFLDADGGGEVDYHEFARYGERIQIPDNFVLMYMEPFRVEKTGKGDQFGHPEEGGAVYRWMYELLEDDTWGVQLLDAV